MTEAERPLVTFALFTYNQEDWIEEAVNSALAQDYENLEVILSDDCSSDRTFFRMKNLAGRYSGPHKIRVIRNEKNLGIGLHVQKILAIAQGELVVLAAGDDVSLSHRVSTIYENWVAFDKPAAVASSLSVVDKDGRFIEHSRNERFECSENYIVDRSESIRGHFSPNDGIKFLGATLCYSRRTIHFFGGFYPEIGNEDSIYLGRALLLGDVLALKEKLVLHRITGANVSASIEDENSTASVRRGVLDTQLTRMKEVGKRSSYLYSRIKLFEQQISDVEKARNENLVVPELCDKVVATISKSLDDCKLNYFLSKCTLMQFFFVLFTNRSKWSVVRMYAAARLGFLRFLITRLSVKKGRL